MQFGDLALCFFLCPDATNRWMDTHDDNLLRQIMKLQAHALLDHSSPFIHECRRWLHDRTTATQHWVVDTPIRRVYDLFIGRGYPSSDSRNPDDAAIILTMVS